MLSIVLRLDLLQELQIVTNNWVSNWFWEMQNEHRTKALENYWTVKVKHKNKYWFKYFEKYALIKNSNQFEDLIWLTYKMQKYFMKQAR